MQPANAATSHNAFAVQFGNKGSKCTLPEGAFNEQDTQATIILKDAIAGRNKSYKVVREFSGNNVYKNDLENEKLNPFIIVNYSDGSFPYAIEVPVKNFQPATERVNIGDEYNYFNAWAKSKGTEHSDWYKYYKTTK